MTSIPSLRASGAGSDALPSSVLGGGRLRLSTTMAGVIALAVAVAAPQVFSSDYDLDVLVKMVLNSVLALGLSIVVRSGRMSLAQATFGGIGGYTSGLLMMQLDWPWWPAWVAAGCVGAMFGLVLGLTSLRLRGFYFAIATFTFSLIVIQVLSAWRNVTGGLSGMFGLPVPDVLFGQDWLDARVYYYFGLLLVLVAICVCYLCTHGSRFGRRLSALGADEILAASIGIPAPTYRILAFTIASAIGGLAGSLSAHFIGGISPTDIIPSQSVFILIMVLAGGSRSMIGPVIGAIILTGIPEFLRASAQWAMILYGFFLLAYVFFFRDGLVPLASRVMSALGWGERRTQLPPAEGIHAAQTGYPPVASPPPVKDHSAPVKVEGLVCAFGELVVLTDVSFEATGGEILGIIGPNGAGKTTLFNSLTGFVPLKAGTVEVTGKSIVPSAARMAGLGMARTFQHPRILQNHTVGQSIRVAAEACGAIRDSGYLAWVIRICSLEGLLDRDTDSLTHYERRLLTLAMAIAACPKILLLDEPLAGMDETETAELIGKIRQIHNQLGCTLLLIEHKLGAVLELCDNVVVLDFGKVIAHGKPQVVARDPKVIEAYLGS